MKWILFTGTWKLTNKEVEEDVRKAVREALFNGNGIITGGAMGVDFFAMDECLQVDQLNRLRVILPTKLDFYTKHYYKAYEEGKINQSDCDNLCDLLIKIQKISPISLLEMPFKKLTQYEYDERNTEEVKYADEVYAFQVNESTGTQDTIDKAKAAGLTISLHKKYKI